MSDPNLPPPPPKRRGCMFYGCMTIVVLMVVCVLLVVGAFFFVKNAMVNYTDTAPVQLAKVEVSDDDYQKLKAKVDAFSAALDQGKSAEPLVLTENDINALIAKSGKSEDVANDIHVSVKGDELGGEVSVPLTKFDWLAKGRYLNGEATFNVLLENGVLNVTVRDIKVKGTPLPDYFMSALRSQNLAADVTKDADTAAAIKKFESIQVKDSTVIVKAKAPQ